MKNSLSKIKYQWLVDSIYCTEYNGSECKEYDITDNLSDKEKLEYIRIRLEGECLYSNNVKRFKGNIQDIIADHLMGLPSWLKIPYSNYDIIQLGKEWGYDLSTEKKEDKFCSSYWNGVSMEILKAFRKHKIDLCVNY